MHARIRRGTCAPNKRHYRQPMMEASFKASEHPRSDIGYQKVALANNCTHYPWYVCIVLITLLFDNDKQHQQRHVHFGLETFANGKQYWSGKDGYGFFTSLTNVVRGMPH